MYLKGKDKQKTEKAAGVSNPVIDGKTFIECPSVKETSDIFVNVPDLSLTPNKIKLIKELKKGIVVIADKDLEGRKLDWMVIDY